MEEILCGDLKNDYSGPMENVCGGPLYYFCKYYLYYDLKKIAFIKNGKLEVCSYNSKFSG